ncbi:hypothetical protein A2533_04965 [Candidatus Falkowbacteria bacterium RIFOXYD2_FULL_35_9]|uniref:Uncharacterized protein n=1 Tax=Candidatus Falkowbacteria bacterium RIFOXYC2_FULL_36_12 TaxID=1798002 RepID=A0A1F5SZX4_9BACT|nr:MAG: hypothetical protein A2300_00320 [Candidatus Falkowbacteria bacterium RIFOXYB2_FULL_35_7]OGF32257.1 MAG: hypothetical protein A2478_02945 [Candidatus Falkowbacteria bacterium RIFOXYC2_FULL_36_12]OGF33873.1 MAG: hypothetical protein A2223_03085 [Candidatus Falkowbacteria bacterium RIFOXYA2_FULL_35_8]OGF46414.1 MAG: hypothetical protein A2533_04965 [Candidatus Falkowbacteria bacterium RIFOXYD2_FULL_35_9]
MKHVEINFNKLKDKKVPVKSWLVLLLSFCAVLIVPILGFFTSITRQIFDPESVNPSRTILGEAGFASFLLSSIISIFAITKGVNTLRQGNKSWAVWTGIFLAVLVLAFWIFMVIGEIANPH